MRYIIGFLIGLGLIVLTIVLIFKAFSGGGGEKPQKIDLNSYSTTNTVMRLTIDGPVNADQTHQRIRVTVGRDKVTFEQIQGYQGKLTQTKEFDNNADAYASFLRALSVAGYTSGKTDPKLKDERGYCPLGSRYVYEALSGSDDILRWWNTSCGSAYGNFLGKGDTVRSLFKRQVPGYDKLVTGTAPQ